MMMANSRRMDVLLLFAVSLLAIAGITEGLKSSPTGGSLSRRDLMASCCTSLLLVPMPALAAPSGLGAKLAKKDPAVLKNSVFNLPPSVQIYPQWLRGDWKVSSSFRGYVFPSETIDKQTLTQDFIIPGFQKCSIAATSDVGKENVEYEWRVSNESGQEDRTHNFASQIDAYLGRTSVQEVIYDPKSNPNRLSIDFIDYKTVNAERIELFCNGRESEVYTRDEDGAEFFVCSEFIRQVTFSGGPDVGIPRQVIGNYAHFWTYKKNADNKDQFAGNLLTAVYLDPSDSLFFKEPSKPVAIFSHNFKGERLGSK